jgi:hypothetical protein
MKMHKTKWWWKLMGLKVDTIGKAIGALGFGVIAGLLFAVVLAGCSLLTKQETTQSNIPTAATLKGECAAGAAETPPVRVGACDDFNIAQTGCLALTAQPLVPAQALQVCLAAGYVVSGSFTPL